MKQYDNMQTVMKKQIEYCLILSKEFPLTHPRAGEETLFSLRMLAAILKFSCYHAKLHTIRGNYELWAKRFEKIAAGEAVLSVREWEGKPYRSKQREIARLTREDGIGIQKLDLMSVLFSGVRKIDYDFWDAYGKFVGLIRKLAANDGLTEEDWLEWFKEFDYSKPMAIIHFTPFRYEELIER